MHINIQPFQSPCEYQVRLRKPFAFVCADAHICTNQDTFRLSRVLMQTSMNKANFIWTCKQNWASRSTPHSSFSTPKTLVSACCSPYCPFDSSQFLLHGLHSFSCRYCVLSRQKTKTWLGRNEVARPVWRPRCSIPTLVCGSPSLKRQIVCDVGCAKLHGGCIRFCYSGGWHTQSSHLQDVITT